MINKIRLYRQFLSWGFLREGEKRFRSDIKMWEQEKSFLGAKFYLYSIWNDGQVITKTTILKIKGAKYIDCTPLPEIRIGEKEMKQKYGNKWSVPTNIHYNPLYE